MNAPMETWPVGKWPLWMLRREAFDGWPEPGERLDESALPLRRGVEDAEPPLWVIEAPASG